MRKIPLLALFLTLLGCATADDTYRSILNYPNTALAKSSNGFGMTWKQKSVEYAVYAALATCDSWGPGCVLEQINGSRVTPEEAQDWREDYNRNKKYIRIGNGERGGLVVVSDTGKRDKAPKKVASKPKASNKPSSSSESDGSSGSAFFVTNKGHIVTNYHVIQNCRSTPKIKYKDKDVNVKVIAKDSVLDLALLKADLRNTKYISFSNDQPKKLQRIIASGYPFGEYISDDLKFTSGIVSSLKGPGDDSTLVQVDAALNPGNSGGPIVDEETGELVAVSVMGMKKSISEGQNFGIKTSSVKNFLEANNVKVQSSWFGASDVAKLLEDSTLYTYCD